MNILILLLSVVVLSGCGHTINFRASHFAVPMTGEEQWSGHVAPVVASATKVNVINDITSNPPLRSEVRINEDITAGDLIYVTNIGLDASVNVLKGTDIILDNSLLGLRFQFLNHGVKENAWVAALHGAIGKRNVSTSETSGTTSDADSDVSSTQAGISLGYKYAFFVPYLSYIYESHDVSTKVTNSHGSFGPYDDKGVHQYYSLGVTTHGKGLRFAVEYNYINIKWDNSDNKSQNTLGLKVGFAW
ncbi:hypothetical protein [Bdellovibrio bacteriovorus]|uniref:hypothetical protein n=1 Tax=Bdellovibrio bacteriovorus TaxID=959 RepID=UPI0035A715FC